MTADPGAVLFWGAFVILVAGWPLGLVLLVSAFGVLVMARRWGPDQLPSAGRHRPPDDLGEWVSG